MAVPCVVCAANTWEPLPVPVRERALLSDHRVWARSLAKAVCGTCGFITSRAPLDPCDLMAVFADGYALYDHPVGSPLERQRQHLYAEWIAAALEAVPDSVFEVGCGNGSLLLELGARWPGVRMAGIDPSEAAVGHGCAAGLALSQGFADDDPGAAPAALVASVNVIEHTVDPLAFLRALARRVRPDGTVAVVCPDASWPSVELMFLDHQHSFTPEHLARLCRIAGLQVLKQLPAPPELGPFQMCLARPHGGSADCEFGHREPRNETGPGGRIAAYRAYLLAWANLEGRLLDGCGDGEVVCFGVGETAALLAAYAPRLWERVALCTADTLSATAFHGLPAVPVDRLEPGDHRPVLLGVRPQAQAALATRLASAGRAVIRWDHWIAR